MSNPADTLSKTIDALVAEKSARVRKTLAFAGYEALRQMREAQPPADADEAEERGYRRGLLVAIALLKEARATHEKPLETANVGRAYTVINGVLNYGQFLCSEAESLMGREAFALERIKKETP